jgi:uncharacterized membrane protein SirB2
VDAWMSEFYLEIRFVHIIAVAASGSLFLLRGALLFAGVRWAKAAPLRYLSYTIDTVLLTAALMLTTIIRQYPFVYSWLTVKVVLLAAYIGLGSVAFWAGRTQVVRFRAWLMALAVFAFMVSVARAHHPLGFFSRLVS